MLCSAVTDQILCRKLVWDMCISGLSSVRLSRIDLIAYGHGGVECGTFGYKYECPRVSQ